MKNPYRLTDKNIQQVKKYLKSRCYKIDDTLPVNAPKNIRICFIKARRKNTSNTFVVKKNGKNIWCERYIYFTMFYVTKQKPLALK